jgi:hypothetical protein
LEALLRVAESSATARGEQQRGKIEQLALNGAETVCIAKNMLPTAAFAAGRQGGDWVIGKALKRIGLGGVEKAGPLIMAITYTAIVIDCGKEVAR